MVKVFATIAIVMTLALCSASASAYVRHRSRNGAIVYWSRPEITFTVYRPTQRVGLPDEVLRAVAERAAAAWSAPTVDCTAARIRIGEIVDGPGRVDEDGIDAIVFRERSSCAPDDVSVMCEDPSRVAVTSVYTRRKPGGARGGEAEEVDIEINAARFRWVTPGEKRTPSTVARSTGGDSRHLDVTLVHEFGHALGFEHSCATTKLDGLIDDRGNAVPLCRAADSAARASALYPDPEEPGRSLAARLSADDIRGLCEAYPGTIVAASENIGTRRWEQAGFALSVLGLIGVPFGARALRRRRARERSHS